MTDRRACGCRGALPPTPGAFVAQCSVCGGVKGLAPARSGNDMTAARFSDVPADTAAPRGTPRSGIR